MKWAAGKLYCNTVIILQLGSVGLARIVLQYKYCIAGWEAGLAVSQYTGLYCGWNGCRRPNCIAIQNCIVTGGMGVGRRCWACRALGERAQGTDGRHGQARRQAGAGRARGRRAASALGRAGAGA